MQGSRRLYIIMLTTDRVEFFICLRGNSDIECFTDIILYGWSVCIIQDIKCIYSIWISHSTMHLYHVWFHFCVFTCFSLCSGWAVVIDLWLSGKVCCFGGLGAVKNSNAQNWKNAQNCRAAAAVSFCGYLITCCRKLSLLLLLFLCHASWNNIYARYDTKYEGCGRLALMHCTVDSAVTNPGL